MTDIELKQINIEDPEDKIWHPQQELILKKWSEIGSSYRFMHEKSYAEYKKRSFRFALPVIILSTITGTANFAQGTFPKEWQLYVSLCIGFLNLSVGLITTISQFLRVNELLEGHRAASIAYSKFSRNISVELSLPREDRSSDGTQFINICRNELDRLIEQGPTIDDDIIKDFSSRFGNVNFMKPEILNITAVKIYNDDSKEKTKQKLRESKHTGAIKNELLKEENTIRQLILKELMEEQKIHEGKIQKEIIEKKKQKKNNLSVSNIDNNLKHLLEKLKNEGKHNDILTEPSSLQGSEGITTGSFNVKKNNIVEPKMKKIKENTDVLINIKEILESNSNIDVSGPNVSL